jgi:uncharacterized protein (DUF427 family)
LKANGYPVRSDKRWNGRTRPSPPQRERRGGVEVEISGTVVADSTRTVMLFETYLPTRYYLPREDVRMELLVPTDTASVCAYKGQARFWSAHVNDTVTADVAWSYEDPHNYATSVEDMICFLNERVDLCVDGDRVARPRSPWSD